jgi:hypothetical protein
MEREREREREIVWKTEIQWKGNRVRCIFVSTKRNEREDRFVASCDREKCSSVASEVEVGFYSSLQSSYVLFK